MKRRKPSTEELMQQSIEIEKSFAVAWERLEALLVSRFTDLEAYANWTYEDEDTIVRGYLKWTGRSLITTTDHGNTASPEYAGEALVVLPELILSLEDLALEKAEEMLGIAKRKKAAQQLLEQTCKYLESHSAGK